MPALYIVGTGGLAKEIAQLARRIDPNASRWSRMVYVAQSISAVNTSLPYGTVELSDSDLNPSQEQREFAIGIGNPTKRKVIADALSRSPLSRFPNLIHPSVEIDENYISMGMGNLVAKGVVMTCDIHIGSFNLFNWNVTVGHDARIGSYNTINPGANISGYVTISDECQISTGVQICEHLSIASQTTIGAGAVVVDHIYDANGTYLGIPAKRRT